MKAISLVGNGLGYYGDAGWAQNEKSRPETGRHNKRKNAKTDKWLLSKYQNVSVAISPIPQVVSE